MVSVERLRLQLEQLRDTIREQNRLILLDMEPSAQELDDLVTLLGSVKSSLEHAFQILPSDIIEDYGQMLTELEDLPIDGSSYELTPHAALAPAPDMSRTPVHALTPALVSSESAASKGALKSSISSPKKKVRFSPGVSLESGSVPYKDDPDTDYNPDANSTLYHDNEELILDQDRRLDTLAVSVGRQHQLGTSIDDELRTHLDLLDDVEAQTTRSQGTLDTARRRVETINRKTREGGSCMLIAVLTLVLFILLLL